MSSPQQSTLSPMTSAFRPPRPPNAFILFRSALCQQWKKEEREKNQELKLKGEKACAKKDKETNKNNLEKRSKRASLEWANASEDEKKRWQEVAMQFKLQHMKTFPNYKYMPMNKAEKERLRLVQKAQRVAQKEAERVEKNAHRVGQGRGAKGGSGKSKKVHSSPPYAVPSRIKRVETPMSSASSSSYGFSSTAAFSSRAISPVAPSPMLGHYSTVFSSVYSPARPVPAPLFAVPASSPFPVPAPEPVQAMAVTPVPPQESFMEMLMNDSDATIASYAQPAEHLEVIPDNQQGYPHPAMADSMLMNFNMATMATQPAGHLRVVNGNQQSQLNAGHLDDQLQLDAAPKYPVIPANKPSEAQFTLDDMFDFSPFDVDFLGPANEDLVAGFCKEADLSAHYSNLGY